MGKVRKKEERLCFQESVCAFQRNMVKSSYYYYFMVLSIAMLFSVHRFKLFSEHLGLWGAQRTAVPRSAVAAGDISTDACFRPFAQPVLALPNTINAIPGTTPHARSKGDEVDRVFAARHLLDRLEEVCRG